MKQDGEQLKEECPKCKTSAVGKSVLQNQDGTYTEFHFECPECHHKWGKANDRGRFVPIDMTPRGAKKKRGRKRRGKPNKTFIYLNPFINSDRFKVLHDKPCPVCHRPMCFEEKDGVFAVWCAFDPCKSIAANNGAESATLQGALDKFFRMMESQK